MSSVLRLHLARLPAGLAIVLAIFTQAYFVLRLAVAAIFLALALMLRLVADAAKIFPGHGRRLPRFALIRK